MLDNSFGTKPVFIIVCTLFS
ncbi:MAG: hypothetical protein ACO245_05730, partial [Ilumatobacteraceae bacterium]